MSLAIEPGRIEAVLLADGWHRCAEAFEIDAYEFVDPVAGPLYSAGAGFRFRDDEGDYVAGPMTSVLAVRTVDP